MRNLKFSNFAILLLRHWSFWVGIFPIFLCRSNLSTKLSLASSEISLTSQTFLQACHNFDLVQNFIETHRRISVIILAQAALRAPPEVALPCVAGHCFCHCSLFFFLFSPFFTFDPLFLLLFLACLLTFYLEQKEYEWGKCKSESRMSLSKNALKA